MPSSTTPFRNRNSLSSPHPVNYSGQRRPEQVPKRLNTNPFAALNPLSTATPSAPETASRLKTKIGFLNVNGISGKEEEVNELMRKEDLDVLMLAELKCSHQSLRPFKNMLLWNPNPLQHTTDGFGLILHPERYLDLKARIKVVKEDKSGCWFSIDGMLVGGLYMHCSSSEATIAARLAPPIDTLEYVILGDMNGWMGSDADGNRWNAQGNLIDEVMVERGITLREPEEAKFTFHGGMGRSVVDHVLTSGILIDSRITRCYVSDEEVG